MNFKTCYHLPIKFMPSFIKNSNALPRVTAIYIQEHIILCFNKKYGNTR